jgi:WD40 repeat protein
VSNASEDWAHSDGLADDASRSRVAGQRRPPPLRVFISSPGDVPEERLRADLIIDRLAQDYSRFFALKAYRWEHEPMLATGTFQDAIEPPSAFDIVILILWSRLGTPLPKESRLRTYAGIDGRAPVTGTEWEYEEALKVAREKGAPDILAFRNVSPALIATHDPDEQRRSLGQLNALNDFWTRHFADRGVFLSAYDTYRTLEEFSERLEQSLRKLIDRRIEQLGGQGAGAGVIWRQSPFRGLEAFEFEHAAIYFGRGALVAKATEQLASQMRAGTAFLLVSGASGSGKSSLVNAGLIPPLMKPQRIQGAAIIRRLAFRPSQGGNDVILGLVEALTQKPSSPDIGLPELLGPGQSAADLAKHLRAAVDEPGFAFSGALGRVTQQGRASGRVLAYEEAKLILAIDQLEELFTATGIPTQDQRLFIRLLGGLARSRAVWVVATIRSDFWHRAAEIPELIALCAGNGRIDVAAPSQAEILEMIRNPALMAGLSFGVHGRTHLGLDAVLAQDAASEPGVLPLLSFTLEALYAEDVQKSGGHVLSHATYENLGGLEGAITKRADEVVASLPETTRKALPRVLRSLATVSGGERIAAARSVPRDTFALGSDARAIVDALTKERLLVASSEGAVPTVRFAHEALISNWGRARNQLIADRRDLETRALVERQQARWAAAPPESRRALLLRDPDLANAIDLDKRWGDELPPQFRDFVARSVAAAQAALRRRRALIAAVIFCLAGLTMASFGALYIAEAQRNQALITQSKTLAQNSSTAVADGNAALGVSLALAGLPQQINTPDRPFVSAAEYALEDAFDSRRDRFILSGHTGTVWSAAYSPHGERVVTASDDNTARVWDAATGATIAVLKGHEGRVWMAVFSPAGNRVATASDDKTARIWDAATGATIAVLQGHQGAVSAVAFSPDSKRIATASDDDTARIWNGTTGELIAVLRGHRGPVNSVAFSPDGTTVVTASADDTARLWNAADGAPIATLQGHRGFVDSAQFSPDGARVVTASWDKTARVWDAHSGKLIATLSGHENFVLAAAFSPDSKSVVTASADNTAMVWNAESGAMLTQIKGHEGWVVSAIFAPNGERVLTASNDGTARLWSAKNGTPNGVFRGHQGFLNSAVFSPDGTHVLTASYDKTARLWDTDPRDFITSYEGDTEYLNTAAFSPDGKRIVTASDDKTARIWDAATGKQLMVLKHDDAVHNAAYSNDGKHILTASGDNIVRIWDAESGELIQMLRGHTERLWAAAFSPHGKRVISGSWDRTARIFDVATGKTLVVLRGHEGVVSAVGFSPDGKRVITGSWDRTARIWDASSGALLVTLKGHDNRIASAVFSSDSTRVLTSSEDTTARLWDAASGQLISIFRGHDKALNSAEFSPDGRRILTSSNDMTARLWDLDTATTIAALRGHDDAVRDAEFSPDGTQVVTASWDTTAALWRMSPRCQALIDAARHDQSQQAAGLAVNDEGQGRPLNAPALELFNAVFAFILPKAGDQCE